MKITKKLNNKNNDDFAKIYQVYSMIESCNNFEKIENILNQNTLLLEKIIQRLRSMKPVSMYNGQKYYSRAKKALALPKEYYPVKSTPDGNCLYHSLSLLYFSTSKLKFSLIIKLCSIYIMFKYRFVFEKLIKINLKNYLLKILL